MDARQAELGGTEAKERPREGALLKCAVGNQAPKRLETSSSYRVQCTLLLGCRLAELEPPT